MHDLNSEGRLYRICIILISATGSIVWCINGFFVWYPLYRPDTEFPGEVDSGGGITACLGATIFEVGAALAMLEAVNENRTDCFGWALEQVVDDGLKVAKGHPECTHHHRYRRSLFGRRSRSVNGGTKRGGAKGDLEASDEGTEVDGEGSDPRNKRTWSWWPSWYELRTHYFRELGFLACFSQMIGATIFWISGIVGVPSILGGLSTPVENGIYWVPQVSYAGVPNVPFRLADALLGCWRLWLHHFKLLVHGGDTGQLVATRVQSVRLAHRLLEPGGRHRILSLRSPWIRCG